MNLDAPISSIMTAEVECVDPSQKLVDIKHIYEKTPFHHHIPVVDNGKLVGVVSLLDFMRHIHYASLDDNDVVYLNSTVQDIMIPNPTTLSADAKVREAVKLLSTGEFHAIIVEQNGAVNGILSTTDILKQLMEN